MGDIRRDVADFLRDLRTIPFETISETFLYPPNSYFPQLMYAEKDIKFSWLASSPFFQTAWGDLRGLLIDRQAERFEANTKKISKYVQGR